MSLPAAIRFSTCSQTEAHRKCTKNTNTLSHIT
jgi:hypothetical protein